MDSQTLVWAKIRGLLFIIACSCSLPVTANAERVGYSFEGNFSSGGSTYNLFGVSVPSNAPITGTFTYDTTIVGIDWYDGTKAFRQDIQHGFTFNVLNPDTNSPLLQLVARQYQITVGNDYQPSNSPTPVDYMSVDYASYWNPPPSSITVNGAPYNGPIAALMASLSWDPTTFDDPDEPKLHRDLPHDMFYPFAGSVFSGSLTLFTVTSFSQIISPKGDYNYDGAVDMDDYLEWRNAFGGIGDDFSYADGNADGVVNGADYIVWRNAFAQASALAQDTSSVPEPSAFVLAADALLMFAGHCRGRYQCGLHAQD